MAVKQIGKYLLSTKDKGLLLNPKLQLLDCWVNANFVGNWDRRYANVDPLTAKSRSGYVVTYAACPIMWASKLQSEVVLSTAEAKYKAILLALCDVTYLMQLAKEIMEMTGMENKNNIPMFHCTLFKDNLG